MHASMARNEVTQHTIPLVVSTQWVVVPLWGDPESIYMASILYCRASLALTLLNYSARPWSVPGKAASACSAVRSILPLAFFGSGSMSRTQRGTM